MMSDFKVKLHLIISDVGRWVGQRGSDVRYVILDFQFFFLNSCFFWFFLDLKKSFPKLVKNDDF